MRDRTEGSRLTRADNHEGAKPYLYMKRGQILTTAPAATTPNLISRTSNAYGYICSGGSFVAIPM